MRDSVRLCHTRAPLLFIHIFGESQAEPLYSNEYSLPYQEFKPPASRAHMDVQGFWM